MVTRPADTSRPVAVFDIGLPPGLAFLRSLDSAGVPVTAYAATTSAAGRWSRHAKCFRQCPPLDRVDEFTDWLAEEMEHGRIDLVAPTSDWVAFSTAVARARTGADDSAHPSVDAVLNCLLKGRFTTSMAEAGFPTPATALPRSAGEAICAARRMGYPVVLKPRSHLGVGPARGDIVRSEAELLSDYAAGYDIGRGQSTVLTHDQDLALPLLQKYYAPDDVDLISVTGCLAPDGELLALGHSRKIRQSPPNTGVGTIFEAVGEQRFTEQAVDAVRQVLGKGIFELEVLVRRDDDEEFWAIDLNPRAFGQITLDIAHGRDLPMLWYSSVTGQHVTPGEKPSHPPRYWQQAVPFIVGAAAMLALGPNRVVHLRDFRMILQMSSVGATRSWRDPLPSFFLAAAFLRHPGGLFRPYWRRRKAP